MTLRDETSDISGKTTRAWDTLYAKTGALVWGETPAPFLVELLEPFSHDLGPDACLLDAGTGEGRHIPLLLATGAHVYACDASEHALRKLPPTLRNRIHTAQCELSATPFGDEQFDLIVLSDVFETLPAPERVLKEMHRLLAHSGKLICNIPDHDDGVATQDMQTLPDGGNLYRGQYYYRFWPPVAATKIFQACGFDVVLNRTYTWHEPSHPGFRNSEHNHTSHVLVAGRALSAS